MKVKENEENFENANILKLTTSTDCLVKLDTNDRKKQFFNFLYQQQKTQYIFLIMAIFALDLATGLLAIIFQEKLVANVRLRLGNKLRSEYGVQASFTAAIDYVSAATIKV